MTLVDLYDRVLQRLEITASGEPGEPEDIRVIEGWYTNLYDMLLTKGLVSWGLAQEVPAYAVIPVVSMLAFVSSRDFGKDPTNYLDGALDVPQMSIAERQLRTQLAKNVIPSRMRLEYF